MNFVCMVQEGLVSDDHREALAQRFTQVSEQLAAKDEADFAIRWIEVAEGSGFTGGARSTTALTTAIVPDGITSDERVRVLGDICEAWTDVTGCTQHEVVAAAIDASYNLQQNYGDLDMPLYRCNIPAGSLAAEHKEQIAGAITEVHCDVTGAPESFVHVFFFDEDVPADSVHKVRGTIRAGRTDANKQAIWDRITNAYSTIANVPAERVSVKTADIPSSWNMEGGRVLPEPGQEAEWLEAHSELADS